MTGGAEADDPRPLPEVDVASLESFVERHGFLSWLGVTVEDAANGHIELGARHDERFVNPSKNANDIEPVHGGVTAALVDTASGFALRTTFDDPGTARLTTTDLDVSYLRPAVGDLIATADVVRAGGSTGVADVSVESETPDGERKQVAVGRATYRLFRDTTQEAN